jgi:hypothetical protein
MQPNAEVEFAAKPSIAAGEGAGYARGQALGAIRTPAVVILYIRMVVDGALVGDL